MNLLSERKYDTTALRTVLAARGIRGFPDESLAPGPDYSLATSFQNWVINLSR